MLNYTSGERNRNIKFRAMLACILQCCVQNTLGTLYNILDRKAPQKLIRNSEAMCSPSLEQKTQEDQELRVRERRCTEISYVSINDYHYICKNWKVFRKHGCDWVSFCVTYITRSRRIIIIFHSLVSREVCSPFRKMMLIFAFFLSERSPPVINRCHRWWKIWTEREWSLLT